MTSPTVQSGDEAAVRSEEGLVPPAHKRNVKLDRTYNHRPPRRNPLVWPNYFDRAITE